MTFIVKPWQIVLVAFGCLVVVVSPLIIVVLWYKRKVKTVKAGYVKFTEQGGELRYIVSYLLPNSLVSMHLLFLIRKLTVHFLKRRLTLVQTPSC